MSPQTRMGRALDRLAAGTGVLRSRHHDSAAAERNGTSTRETRLEEAVVHLERAADALWQGLDTERGSP